MGRGGRISAWGVWRIDEEDELSWFLLSLYRIPLVLRPGPLFGAGRPRLTLFGAPRSSTDGDAPFFLRGVHGAPNLEPPPNDCVASPILHQADPPRDGVHKGGRWVVRQYPLSSVRR
jgi:hypothetical protein